jgi:hypothetical protein
MKRILLTSTALVMAAGIAAADGHSSLSWSGTATAGVARQGGDAAVAVKVLTAGQTAMRAAFIAASGHTIAGPLAGTTTTVAAATFAANMVTERARIAAILLAAKNVRPFVQAAYDPILAAYNARVATLDEIDDVAAVAQGTPGDFKAYSEVNATVTGTVTAGGMTLSAGVSLDGGTGYDFADDDTFDTAKGTASVGLDSVSLDMGSAGKLTLDDNNIAHLVDGDDDAAGDVSYTNTFGGATFTAVLDLEKDDLDTPAALAIDSRAAVAADVRAFTAATATTAAIEAIVLNQIIPAVAAVDPDTQWSAKVSMPVGAGSVYVAMDEESGSAFGGSAMLSGATVSIDSKLEAKESDLKISRSNTLGVSYVVGAVTAGATYNSVKDGDQWGVSASYVAGDMTVGFSTDEGSDWSVTGAYALGTGASVQAGVNYTEDAFLGLSFAF